MTVAVVPIALEHGAGFHACLALRFDGVYYDALQMSLLLD
jgi:hypothetical protein